MHVEFFRAEILSPPKLILAQVLRRFVTEAFMQKNIVIAIFIIYIELGNCYCGDGLIQIPESCDDMNDQPGDGCAECSVERGWNCSGEASVCTEICLDGVVTMSEECDDGNNVEGDGCTLCILESGWQCEGSPSKCWSGVGQLLYERSPFYFQDDSGTLSLIIMLMAVLFGGIVVISGLVGFTIIKKYFLS